MNRWDKRLYLDKFNGKLFGVCAGLGDFAGLNSMWPRLAVIVLLFTPVSPLVIIGYFVLAIVLPKKPVHLYRESYFHVFSDEDTRPHKRSENP